MANTVLKLKDQSVRVNYHDLAEVLTMLNQRLEAVSVVREVTEPWLKHIHEDLGYVLLDTKMLERSDVITEFDHALTMLSSDLRSGTASPNTSRWRNASHGVRQQSGYTSRVQSVIRELQSVLSHSE